MANIKNSRIFSWQHIRFIENVSTALFGNPRGYGSRELQLAWPEMFVAEGMLYAREFDASYVALDAKEEAIVDGARDLSKFLSVADQRLLSALPRMELPAFESQLGLQGR